MLRRYVIGLILAFLLVLPFSQSNAGVYNTQTFWLDNGMQVVVIPNTRAPVVTHMVWYRIGAADEPVGLSGLTHFLEHLMFKGTDDLAAGEFSDRVAEMGGMDNAFTTHDATAYYQSVARRYLPVVMKMEADRMTDLQLAPEDVDTERNVIIQERNERYNNNPIALFFEEVAAKIYGNHPYGRPVIGWDGEIAGLQREAALDYYKKWYAPNNAIVVVSGDVTTEEVKQLAEKYYAPLPSSQTALKQPWPPVPMRDTPIVYEKEDAKVMQPLWSRHYIAPNAELDNLKMFDALTVLENILGGGPTSRMYQNLVVARKLASEARASYNGINRARSRFILSVTPNKTGDMDDVEKAVDELITDLLKNGVMEEELEAAKSRLITASVYARDSLDGPPRIIGKTLAAGLGLDTVEKWPERIRELTIDDINKAARFVFLPQSHNLPAPVTAILKPAQRGDSQ